VVSVLQTGRPRQPHKEQQINMKIRIEIATTHVESSDICVETAVVEAFSISDVETLVTDYIDEHINQDENKVDVVVEEYAEPRVLSVDGLSDWLECNFG